MRRHLGTLTSRALAFIAVFAVGCDAAEARHTEVRPARASTAPADAFTTLSREAALSAREQVRQLPLSGDCHSTESYLALRRDVARGKPWWRLASRDASENLLGPLRPTTEGGGNLGLLDVALAAHDCDGAKKAAFQVEQALSMLVLAHERALERNSAVRALCDAAVDLGGVLLESDAEVALDEEGVHADALGTMDGLDAGLRALAGPLAGSAAFRDAATTLSELRQGLERPAWTDRGAMVRVTGRAGAALRLFARERGIAVQPPFRARVATMADPVAEPVSRLTVPATSAPADPKRAALGEKLFRDRRLSGKEDRSCAMCHRPERAFTDGRARAASLAPDVTLRNTPTLLYAATQAAQLWDGRVITRRKQALRVLHSAAEMAVTDDDLVRRLRGDTAIRAEAAAAFDDGLTAVNVAEALSEYQGEKLVPASAPVDRFARGERPLAPAQSRGLDVFAGPGRCARCHVPPLFGGTRPNDFAVAVHAVIGVTTDPAGTALDADPGRAAFTRNAADSGAFKTPTVRNAARTAPYFHNGAFPTLESVVGFYDRGGGRGLGHAIPHQDPDVHPLHLSAAQRADLVLFLKQALTDQ